MVTTFERTGTYEKGSSLTLPTLCIPSMFYYFLHVPPYIQRKKNFFLNVKNGFRVAVTRTETRKSQPCPLRIVCALAKSYGDLFYTPKSMPHFLLLAEFSSDSKAISKIFF